LSNGEGLSHYGHDIGVEDTALEAGLGFAVAWDKPDFIGREALLRQREAGPPERRLVQFRLDDDCRLLHHEEPVWVDGELVGAITSGMYGHRIEASLGMGYVQRAGGVRRDWLEAAAFSIEIGWERFAATASLAPFYDPANKRIRG